MRRLFFTLAVLTVSIIFGACTPSDELEDIQVNHTFTDQHKIKESGGDVSITVELTEKSENVNKGNPFED